MLEIERKFLIKKSPDLEKRKYYNIEQGYISLDPEIRIRKKNEKCYITEKSSGKLIRSEIEKEIDIKVYNMLKNLVIGRMIYKTRYIIGNIELDVYHKELTGLYVAEIEFSSREEAYSFVPPSWFGEEITNDKSFKNKQLSQVNEKVLKKSL